MNHCTGRALSLLAVAAILAVAAGWQSASSNQAESERDQATSANSVADAFPTAEAGFALHRTPAGR